jgi:hypothetical protein
MNQANKESIDRTSGSGVFGRDPDTIMALTQHMEQDAVVAEFNLRNFPPLESFTVRWDNWLFRRCDLDPARLKKKVGRPSSHSANTVLSVLGDQDLLSSELKAQCNRAGIGDTLYYQLFAELKEAGRVHKSAINNRWEQIRLGNNVDGVLVD